MQDKYVYFKKEINHVPYLAVVGLKPEKTGIKFFYF
jgi:hypothetical protein